MKIILKKRKIVLLVILLHLFLLSCAGANNQSISSMDDVEGQEKKVATDVEMHYKKHLVGYWHYGQYEGQAGENDRYEFLENRLFIFTFNDYDGEKRLLSFSGEWDVVFGNLLMLTIKNKKVLEGGEYINDSEFVSTEYIILNGKEKEVEMEEAEIVLYPLSEIEVRDRKEYNNPIMMRIGGKEFYKLFTLDDEVDELEGK